MFLAQIYVFAQDKLIVKKYYNYTYTVDASHDTILSHINQIALPYFISSDKSENGYVANYIRACTLDVDTFNMNKLNPDWISPLPSKKPGTTKIYYKKEICNKDILTIRFYKNEYDCCQHATSLSRQFNYPFTLDRNTKKVLLLKDVADTILLRKEYLALLSTVKKDNTLDAVFYEEFIKTTTFEELVNKNIALDHAGITFYLTLKTTTDRLKEYAFQIDAEKQKHLILPYIKKYIKNFPPESYTVDVD